jgi:phage-related protein
MGFRRQWREYKTEAGNRPVKKFLDDLSYEEKADVAAAMNEVKREGLPAARHLRGEIYEVRAESSNQSFRVLFAAEGRFKQVLLSVVAFSKKTQRTPPQMIQLAEGRLKEWRRRSKNSRPL